MRGIHWWSVHSPHIGWETRKTFPFHDVVMEYGSVHWMNPPKTETATKPWAYFMRCHYSHITVASWGLKLSATRLFLQRFVHWLITKGNHQSSALLAFCKGNLLVISQMASNAESVSMAWRQHVLQTTCSGGVARNQRGLGILLKRWQ